MDVWMWNVYEDVGVGFGFGGWKDVWDAWDGGRGCVILFERVLVFSLWMLVGWCDWSGMLQVIGHGFGLCQDGMRNLSD